MVKKGHTGHMSDSKEHLSGMDTALSAFRGWPNAMQVNILPVILQPAAENSFEQGWRFPCCDSKMESNAAGVHFLTPVFFVENIKQRAYGGKEGKREVRKMAG